MRPPEQHKTNKQELLSITKAILKQKYFCFQNNVYMQKEGLAMVAPLLHFFGNILKIYKIYLHI
jgi:hypothetical protein